MLALNGLFTEYGSGGKVSCNSDHEAISRMRRFKIDAKVLGRNTAIVTGPEANHMVNVLRLKAGDPVTLFDGSGLDYAAIIKTVSKDEVRLSIEAQRRSTAESPVRITVAQGFLKEKKMDTLVRQLTELGISRWIPFFGARSVPRPDAGRLAKRAVRWQKIADAALKQCRRAQSLQIEAATDFKGMLQQADRAAVRLLFWEEEDRAFPGSGHLPNGDPQDVFVVLGPEGGLTAEEADRARKAGFQSVSLGPRILRAETATLVAGSLVQYLFGDLGKGRR